MPLGRCPCSSRERTRRHERHPNIVTGDFEAPTIEPPPSPRGTGVGGKQRREIHDVWVAGTEEPRVASRPTRAPRSCCRPRMSLRSRSSGGPWSMTTTVRRRLGSRKSARSSTWAHSIRRPTGCFGFRWSSRARPSAGQADHRLSPHRDGEDGRDADLAPGPTNVTRMDYLSPFHNELAFSLAVEELLGVEIPARARRSGS